MKQIIVACCVVLMSCGNPSSLTDAQKAQIDEHLAQYAPYEMHYDASKLNETDKLILKKLVQAASYVDTIYWHQTSKYGLALRDSLQKVKDNPYAKKLLTLFKRNAGPFELLNDHEPFIGNRAYYPGDELYPRGMTAEEFDAYYETLTEEEQKEFMYPYTVIRKDGKGAYKAVRYHEEYKEYIEPMVKLLNECADLTDNESFAKFLRLKADALTTDNYFDADVAWIDVEDSKFDMVFGPFETYSDGIKGVKAKYEASIEVVDQEESQNLDIYTQYLQELEQNLPVPDEYKSVVEGLTAKFVVVQDVIRAGEMAAGYQAVAANLPNDPAVHKQKGTKKTFWKNMFEARFNAIIKPVSERLIEESQLQYLSDEGFFQFVLMHEICHAIGPRTVKVGPKKGMAVNAAIGPNYSPLEEAKADIAGLHSLAYLIDNGVVDKEREKEFYVSYLGSLFRSIRFGLGQAHGKAAGIALNYLLENDGIAYDDASHKWAIDFENFRDGVKSLTSELVILEGDGDNGNVRAFFDRWANLTPELQTSLDSVEDIAIDVMPKYSIKWD
ncbi:hypothetical protein GWO43_16450 [candidate division KSB1 bacterium]|nr:hypothetical protein [candidate division KSB1 bacterium]NIR68724.1 hypothetical protein [candidate division KSB1 bacterium]NIS25541.1 hypothetical protein [candidate division KSB1 bacterium]NIT72434.1 hypothetical protein [candidate division KSB1 bacterium]NIU26218.1 hypothetical protein [candidate division KSB1 bacterium]